MKKMSSYQTLDKILEELKKSSEHEPIDLEQTIKHKYQYISNRDNRAIKEKLIRDKLVDEIEPFGNQFVPERKYQYITYEGLLFIENKGYLGQKRRGLSKTILDYSLAISIVVSGLIASVYYIQEMSRNKECKKEVENHDKPQ
jgi:hypothetical protein